VLHRRLLLLFAALLVFVANAPNAVAHGFEAFPGHGRVVEPAGADRSPDRDFPAKLTTAVALQRAHSLAARAKRGPGDDRAKVPGLCVAGAFVSAPGCVALGDADADARMLGASNTPCCVRGPPSEA
jgi:hypothetical protein